MAGVASDVRLDAGQRAIAYGFLGSLFRPDAFSDGETRGVCPRATIGVLRSLGRSTMSSASVYSLEDLGLLLTALTAAHLTNEFGELFSGPHQILMCESCWIAGIPGVSGEPCQRVLTFCRDHEVSPDLGAERPADHVSSLLTILSALCSRLPASAEENAVVAAQALLTEFLDTYVLPWVPEFLLTVELDPRADAYRTIARATRELLETDRRLLGYGAA